MSGQLTAAEGTGSQEFKQRIYKHLKKTGVVSSLKVTLCCLFPSLCPAVGANHSLLCLASLAVKQQQS